MERDIYSICLNMNIGQGAHGVVCNWANLLPFELCLSDDFRGSCPGQYSLPSQTDFFFSKNKKKVFPMILTVGSE